MMASPSQLSFEFKPQIFSMLQNQNPFGDQAPEQTQKLENFLARLEEEKLKIDAFKRELPLCMQLLNNAMEVSRQQLQSERTSQEARPVLEQFIPLTNPNSTNVETNEGNNIAADKANWMTSAQLWNQESEGGKAPQSPQESEIKLGLNGEAFPELALASRNEERMEEKRNSPEMKRERDASQAHRKARRCWSPDLHRRFVNALHMLGGSQVATPKQIRELMKVDGLTNDEVKSHLQKYRLHTRRPSPSPQAAATAGPQVVVLGSIWVPPEYAAAAAAAHGGAQLYGAHPAATHHVSPLFCSPTTPLPQDRMFPAIAPPPNHQRQHEQQLHLYTKPPVTQRNIYPESGLQGGGDPSESIEDGKSESGSWKADSGGDNGRERRRLEGELQESNSASVVSLKFEIKN